MGALATYQVLTLDLVDDPNNAVYSTTQVTQAINLARTQLAGDAECLRQMAVIKTVGNQQSYAWVNATFVGFPDITPGLGGILSVRSIARQLPVSGGLVKLYGLQWERFYSYHAMMAAPSQTGGIPTRWATYQPGVGGIFWVHPNPDGAYPLQLDPVCYPLPLAADDSTVEALPYPWTDAIPYWAAYQLYLWKQREADAQEMFKLYRLFALRGTQLTTPSQLPDNYPGGAQAAQASARSLIGGPAEARR